MSLCDLSTTNIPIYIYSSRNEGLLVWWRIGLANGMGERVWRQTKFQTFLLTTTLFLNQEKLRERSLLRLLSSFATSSQKKKKKKNLFRRFRMVLLIRTFPCCVAIKCFFIFLLFLSHLKFLLFRASPIGTLYLFFGEKSLPFTLQQIF